MNSKLMRVITFAAMGTMAYQPKICHAQVQVASWLDEAKPASWNKPGLPIPTAPPVKELLNPRCRELERPAELQEDRRIRDRGWHLDGVYQGGWQIVVIGGAAAYDGMCRPWQYQAFVFVHGVFAGTLSPTAMDSRTDGALTRVFLQTNDRITAEYLRYSPKDPACCASHTTSVVFDVAHDEPIVRPVSTSTSSNK